MPGELKVYTRAEVKRHSQPDDCWIIIHDKVYNITKFAKFHPGGRKIILAYGGQDATDVFHDLHRTEVLLKYQPRLIIGRLSDGPDEDDVAVMNPAALSEVPYAESPFWMGWRSAYLKDSHFEFREAVREFLEPLRGQAELDTKADRSPSIKLYQKVGAANILAARLGPGEHLHGKTIFGVRGEDFDYFHEMIVHEEMQRLGHPGWVDGLGTGLVIGLPPVMKFAKDEIRDRVVDECLSGNKRICLAISEPFAGSDVANLKCTAELSPCGQYYIVNGIKKWITNGAFADYFVTAVRTGKDGMGGVTLMLIERSEGLTTSKIKTSYSVAAGTAYVVLEDVKVPVQNVLGKVNKGFQVIMANFNHERWFICAIVIYGCRAIISECFKWAMQRKVFGKPLISQPVIRQKLAHMIAKVESAYAWLESITYQMQQMDYFEQTIKLAGPTALLKLQATRVAYFVSDEACQIFGGRAISRTGMGQYVERFQRSIKFGAILGGSEEIMADLGVRMASKMFPTNSKL